MSTLKLNFDVLLEVLRFADRNTKSRMAEASTYGIELEISAIYSSAASAIAGELNFSRTTMVTTFSDFRGLIEDHRS